MTQLHENPLMEILDRLMQTGLEWDEACMLLATFLQRNEQLEATVYEPPIWN